MSYLTRMRGEKCRKNYWRGTLLENGHLCDSYGSTIQLDLMEICYRDVGMIRAGFVVYFVTFLDYNVEW
jgi:hypothetical protein